MVSTMLWDYPLIKIMWRLLGVVMDRLNSQLVGKLESTCFELPQQISTNFKYKINVWNNWSNKIDWYYLDGYVEWNGHLDKVIEVEEAFKIVGWSALHYLSDDINRDQVGDENDRGGDWAIHKKPLFSSLVY